MPVRNKPTSVIPEPVKEDAEAILAKIREIVEGTPTHRNRAQREAWELIKELVSLEHDVVGKKTEDEPIELDD